MNDGRNVVGDANDVVQGLSSLGLSMGGVPGALANSKVTALAESKVLSAAQLAIDVLKKSTGSGDPYTGDEFRNSSQRLSEVAKTLIAAEPHTDRWDGTASQVYTAVNASHRRCASDVSAADEAVANALDIEADQITRTRQTLGETSQNLTDYDLATCWMNATPPTAAMKFSMDVAAAGAAMATVNATLAILAKNSAENARKILGTTERLRNCRRGHVGQSPGRMRDLLGSRRCPSAPASRRCDAATRSRRRHAGTIPFPTEHALHGAEPRGATRANASHPVWNASARAALIAIGVSMSTDSEKNLQVLADHVRHLTTVQDTAVGQITGANRSIVDPERDMWDTHGIVCSATNFAMSQVESARRNAGGSLSRVSTELSEKLTAAAVAYEDTDSAAAGDIDACGV